MHVLVIIITAVDIIHTKPGFQAIEVRDFGITQIHKITFYTSLRPQLTPLITHEIAAYLAGRVPSMPDERRKVRSIFAQCRLILITDNN